MTSGRPFPRSFLYVPATKPQWFDRSLVSGSDAAVVDLEDAVPIGEKEQSRAGVEAWLATSPESKQRAGYAQVWVRLNREHLEADLTAVVGPAVAGYFVAKCDAEALDRVQQSLSGLEPERGVVPGASAVVGLVETASALADLERICSHERLTALGLGEVDLLADLRIERAPGTEGVVDQLRLQCVVHSAAAGLRAPVAPTSTNFRDLEDFRRTSGHLVRMGFRSRTAIHPDQVTVINEVLTPSAEQIARAEEILAGFDTAAGGIYTDATGKMVDAAVVRAARETLQRRP